MNTIFLLLADVLLILAGIIYGAKFLKKRNYLCGIEWFVMAISGTHFLLWALLGWDFGYSVAHFFDAFSRSFGFPVVAVAGMMVVTHSYQPSRLADVLYFLLGFAGAAVLVAADHAPAFAVYKPPFYLLMCLVFLAYLAYFAWRLHKAGEAVFRMEGFLRPLLQALDYVWFEFAHHVFGIANVVPVLHLVMNLIPLFDEIDA